MMSRGRGRGVQLVVFTIAAVVVFADGFAAVFADGFAAVFADGFAAVFADCLGIAEGSWLQSCLNVYRNPEAVRIGSERKDGQFVVYPH
jgi:hypothetical protein